MIDQPLNYPYEEIIRRFAIMSDKLPAREYTIYRSSGRDLSSLDNIQKEALDMLHHIGLNAYQVEVSFNKEAAGVGGHINLDVRDNIIRINVDESSRYDREIKLGVLAHEICHKLLYDYGMRPTLDYLSHEIDTDLATVYMGLGILTLNGCRKYAEQGLRNHGYLTPETYARAFVLVNAMEHKTEYNTDKSIALDRKSAIRDACASLPKLIDRAEAVESFRQSRAEELASQQRFISILDRYLQKQKASMKARAEKLEAIKKSVVPGKHPNLYKLMQDPALMKEDEMTERLWNILMSASDHDGSVFEDAANIITCPHCNKDFSYDDPQNSYIWVFRGCPHCGKEFIWDNRTRFQISNGPTPGRSMAHATTNRDTATVIEQRPHEKSAFEKIIDRLLARD